MDTDPAEIMLEPVEGAAPPWSAAPVEQSGRRGPRNWVVILALLLGGAVGWWIGRTSDSSSSAPSPISNSDPSDERAESPTDTPETSPGALGTVRELTLEVAPPFATQPIELVLLDAKGAVFEADLATQRMTQIAQLDATDTKSRSIVAGDDWTLVNEPGREPTLLSREGLSRPLDGVALSEMPDPSGENLWRLFDNTARDGTALMLEEFDQNGEPTGRRIELPSAPVGFQTDAEVLVPTGGGIYVMSAQRRQLLATGELLGAGPRHLLVRQCDPSYACETVLVGFEAAANARTDADFETLNGVTSQPLSISASGWVAVLTQPGSMSFLDLAASNESTSSSEYLVSDLYLPSTEAPWSPVWSPDGRFAFWITDSGIVGFDTESRVIAPVTLPVGSSEEILALAVRPSE